SAVLPGPGCCCSGCCPCASATGHSSTRRPRPHSHQVPSGNVPDPAVWMQTAVLTGPQTAVCIQTANGGDAGRQDAQVPVETSTLRLSAVATSSEISSSASTNPVSSLSTA